MNCDALFDKLEKDRKFDSSWDNPKYDAFKNYIKPLIDNEKDWSYVEKDTRSSSYVGGYKKIIDIKKKWGPHVHRDEMLAIVKHMYKDSDRLDFFIYFNRDVDRHNGGTYYLTVYLKPKPQKTWYN
jgi:hypothetical protein